MGTGSSDKNYLIELDCSRDLAAIFILVYHFIIESNTAGYIHFSPFILQMLSFWGSIGVNLFFLLSGASLTHRWQNRWNLKEYVKGRILAIYPDFWVIFFSLFVYGEVLHGNNASVPKWKLIFSIIGVDGYMQQFTSTFYKIGEWFLGCLLILYFLFPIFRYFVSPNKRTFFGGSILFLFWLIGPSLCLPYDGNHMSVMYAAPDKNKAVLYTYDIHPRFGEKLLPVKLQGLDAKKMYKVKEINLMPNSKSNLAANEKTYSGDYLMKVGINAFTTNQAFSRVIELTAE